MEEEKVKELIDTVRKLRKKQKQYFACGKLEIELKRQLLIESRQLEKTVDELLMHLP